MTYTKREKRLIKSGWFLREKYAATGMDVFLKKGEVGKMILKCEVELMSDADFESLCSKDKMKKFTVYYEYLWDNGVVIFPTFRKNKIEQETKVIEAKNLKEAQKIADKMIIHYMKCMNISIPMNMVQVDIKPKILAVMPM